jgi:hypothetical protein
VNQLTQISNEAFLIELTPERRNARRD